MLLKKSFCTCDQNFFWLYTRLSCKNLGDLTVWRKTRWRPRYRDWGHAESSVVGQIFLQQANWRRAVWDFFNSIGHEPKNSKW